MKLLVIVLCLFSERFLVHLSSLNRYQWFQWYMKTLETRCSSIPILSSPWVLFFCLLVPILLALALVLALVDDLLYGVLGFFINIAIFYYCIGPENPFYPFRNNDETSKQSQNDLAMRYLTDLNCQLFALIFWYVILGPLGALAYRLISLSRSYAGVDRPATIVSDILDWLPARMTALFYLLVGNFQAGLPTLFKLLLSAPQNNKILIGSCGLAALEGQLDQERDLLSLAEQLAFHALIMLLTLLACFIIAARF